MYIQILSFIGAAFLLLTLSRLGLVLWQWRRVSAVQGLGRVMLGGLRIDAHLVALGVAPGLLLAPWLDGMPAAMWLLGLWLQLVWLLICLLELSTPLFIVEYDTRPNRIYIDYLKYPQEVFGMLWRGYRGAAVLVLVLLALVGWVGHGLFAAGRPALGDMGWLMRAALWLLGVALAFLAIRGTLRHRPINPSNVAFCGDALVNTLPLNSLYNVLYAAYCLKNERAPADAYGKLPDEEVIDTVRRCAGLAGEAMDPAIPTLHAARPSPLMAGLRRPRNVVVIVEESLGARFTGFLGDTALTPCLDALSAEAWTFTRAYATGTRSVRGLEALVAGFPPALSEAVLRLPDTQSRFFTLAQYLRPQGYKSHFVYGGEAHFDNMKSFFMGNGFDVLHDQPTFQKPAFSGTWGVSDEDMFGRIHEILSAPSEQPQLVLAFSVSNHSPWEYPAGRIEPVGEPASVENTVRYADWALGRFFEQARTQPYWEDTLFLVAADHDARVGGKDCIPLRHFHIPALILGGSVAPRLDARIISQIDLPVTLLGLLGGNAMHPMIGHDLSDPAAGGRALMQYGENFGYLKGDLLTVLEPQRAPTLWRYGPPDSYQSLDVDAGLAREALAHALWPHQVYRARGYTLPGC